MSDLGTDYLDRDAAAGLTPAALGQYEPTDRDYSDMVRVLTAASKRPTLVPEAFWAQVIDQIQVGNLQIPVGQLLGFSQFTAQAADPVITAETGTSTSFDNLATVGPTLTGLPDGQYLVIWGATWDQPSGAGNTGYMGVKVNATEAADDDSIFWSFGANVFGPGARAEPFTLSNGGDNTLLARYRVVLGSPNNGRWRNRWMVALKFANA